MSFSPNKRKSERSERVSLWWKWHIFWLREGLKCFYLSREGNTGILLLAMNSWHRKTLFFDKIGLCIGVLWNDFERAIVDLRIFTIWNEIFKFQRFFPFKVQTVNCQGKSIMPGPESKQSTEWGGGALFVNRSSGPHHSHSLLQQPSNVLILTRA